MMARQNVRLPILTIEQEAPFFWVSLGLRESNAYRALVVQDFEGVAVEDEDNGAGEVGVRARPPRTQGLCYKGPPSPPS